MAENGEEKLIAVARHIAKTLGHNENMADDILQIFSNFDGRFREKLIDEKQEEDDEEDPHRTLDHAFNSLHRQISPYLSSDQPIWSDHADSSSFLDSLDDLLSLLRTWSPLSQDKSISAILIRADDLLHQSMFRLQSEFRTLIERAAESFDANVSVNYAAFDEDSDDDDLIGDDQVPIAHPVTSYDIVVDALPAGIVSDLHEIAKRMVAAGYTKECCHAYSASRRDFLEESLSRLGLHKLSIEEVQRTPWSDLEDEIEKWTKATIVSVRILFPSERRLCDRVFSGGAAAAADLAFMEVCRGSAVQLLNFADAVAIGSRAPERLFKVLDVFETLRDLMSEIDDVFSDQYCSFLRNEAVTIWKRLGEAIRGIFMELENLIRRDPAKAAVPGGGLHPITRYVMNYLKAACRSRLTLEQVFDEGGPPADFRRVEASSSLSVQMAWIMELLESNLEAKAKIYRDPALCSVFMMNNGRYIVQKVRDSELGSLLGDDWIRKHAAKVKQCHVNYMRSSWNKVLGVLKLDNGTLGSSNGGALRAMKEKLKLFNLYFEEICKAQSTWVIFDEQMREEMRISVDGNLTPAYRSFLGRFKNLLDVGKHDKHIRFSVEDVVARIGELFEGRIGSAGGRK